MPQPTAETPADTGPSASAIGAPSRTWPMLAVLSSAAFLATCAGTTLAPFLLDIARDLQVDLAAVANLVSVMTITWGIMSLVAGAASDRVGRRPILVLGIFALGAALLGVSQAASYPLVAFCQMLAGFGGGSYMGTVFATVSDHVAPHQRGRALGWIVTGQSLSLVLGVPLVTYIGSFGGWRGALIAQSLATMLIAIGVWLAVPRRPLSRVESTGGRISARAALNLRVVALLGAGAMERTCFGGFAIYLATYLILSYGLALQELALGLLLVALGSIAGNLLGGQLADRVPSRPLFFAATSIGTAALALPLLLWQPGLAISLGLGFVYALCNALGRPALIAAISAVPAEVRGTVLGLNITTASLGWLSATALGGWLITQHGFPALSLLCTVSGLLGALLAVTSWYYTRPHPLRIR